VLPFYAENGMTTERGGRVSSENQLIVVQIPSGPIETNAFVVVDPQTREALIIDAPPDSIDAIERRLTQHNATPVALVLTHTHWDHIGDTAAVAERWGIPVVVHDLDRPRLESPQSPVEIMPAKADRLIDEGDEVSLGSRSFRVMHTPGHSPGQISLYSEPDKVLFGGDTLFPDGYGRVDIPGASEEQTVATMTRLLELPDDVTVFTGHGRSTAIGRERRWMQQVADAKRLL
jgi:hydroxyacylglutathione hydrolase